MPLFPNGIVPLYPAGSEPLPPGIPESDREAWNQQMKMQKWIGVGMESCVAKCVMAGAGGVVIGAFISLMSSSFAYEDPLLRAQAMENAQKAAAAKASASASPLSTTSSSSTTSSASSASASASASSSTSTLKSSASASPTSKIIPMTNSFRSPILSALNNPMTQSFPYANTPAPLPSISQNTSSTPGSSSLAASTSSASKSSSLTLPSMAQVQASLSQTPQRARDVFLEMGRGMYRSGKGFGKVGALFAGLECVVEGYRAKNDMINPVAAGFIAGGILARNSGPKAAAGGAVAFAAFSAVIDLFLRREVSDED